MHVRKGSWWRDAGNAIPLVIIACTIAYFILTRLIGASAYAAVLGVVVVGGLTLFARNWLGDRLSKKTR